MQALRTRLRYSALPRGDDVALSARVLLHHPRVPAFSRSSLPSFLAPQHQEQCSRSAGATQVARALLQRPASHSPPRHDQDQQQHSVLFDLALIIPYLYPLGTIAGSLACLEVFHLEEPFKTLVLLIPVLLMHVIVPGLDFLAGEHELKIQDAARAQDASPLARALPFLYSIPQLIAQLLTVSTAGWLWSTQGADALPQILLLTSALGMSCAIGHGAGHELIHSRNLLYQAAVAQQMAWSMLWVYTKSHHFHHYQVGTLEDPVTARAGESFYEFFPKYFVGIHQLVWGMEKAEAARKHRSVWDVRNPMLQGLTLQAAFLALSYELGGVAGVGVHLGSAFLGVLYLAAMDYALHYALKRDKMENGIYEPVSPYTSYNSAYPFENGQFFRVLMHSDHHMTGSKPFTKLGMDTTAHWPRLGPHCPALALALFILFIPPLFFKVMDPEAARANTAHKAWLAARGERTTA